MHNTAMSPPEETESMPVGMRRRPDLLASGVAVGGGVLSVFAWAACCVLPLALSLAGVSFAGAAVIAGQRSLLTIVAIAALALGWLLHWRRRRRCAADAACPKPSRAAFWLMILATALVALAVAWEPLVEPWAMVRLATIR